MGGVERIRWRDDGEGGDKRVVASDGGRRRRRGLSWRARRAGWLTSAGARGGRTTVAVAVVGVVARRSEQRWLD